MGVPVIDARMGRRRDSLDDEAAVAMIVADCYAASADVRLSLQCSGDQPKQHWAAASLGPWRADQSAPRARWAQAHAGAVHW